jgi:hypothetical protein
MPRLSRRSLLQGAAVLPLAALSARADARDYASAAEALAEIDRLEADLDARLAALSVALAAAAPLARSVRADHERHRVVRSALRRQLGVAASAGLSSASGPITLPALTALAQDLAHAYAEGLPAIGDDAAVDALAQLLVDDARHLAVLQMWAETEDAGA